MGKSYCDGCQTKIMNGEVCHEYSCTIPVSERPHLSVEEPVLSNGLLRRVPSGYASESAGLLSANRNMLIAIVALCLFLTASLYMNYLDRKSWRAAKVNFVGINQDGSLITLDAAMFKYPVTDANVRSALINFTRLHMERVRSYVQQSKAYAASESFLNEPLKKRLRSHNLVNMKAVAEGLAEEVQIKVLSVSLRNVEHGCENTECQASVIIKKTLTKGSTERTEEETIELSFVLRKEVTDQDVQAQNPMGVTILTLREYPHFHTDDGSATPFKQAASNE
jgi:hypothetical protein